MSVADEYAAAWRFVGAALAAVDDAHLDRDKRLDLVVAAAARLRDQLPWLRAEGGQDPR